MFMLRAILITLFAGLISSVYAENAFSPLPADQAFMLSSHLDQDNKLIIEWKMAPGYYLYRNQVKIKTVSDSQVQIGNVELPAGTIRQDAVHGVYRVYFNSLKVSVPFINATKGKLDINLHYQGCSSRGFCYAPMQKNIVIDLPTHFVSIAESKQDAVTKLFAQHNLFLLVLSFLGLGLLLAFTPCVLPMVPILSGIIVGHGKKRDKKKSFLLSLAYVVGMAATYAVVGIVVALIGSGIQADLQRPWVIILVSGIFVLLSLSLFGFYELRLPGQWQQRVTAWSNRQKGGTYLGVFLMGSLSTLIVSPCVSAPLVGVLAYIGQTGDVVLGAVSLLALGVGMGVPLLLLGLSADKLLPKAGAWMVTIERLFGVFMLAIAIWMLSRMIPGPVTLFLWSVLFICAAMFLDIFSAVPARFKWLSRGFSVLVITYGIILMVGAVMGNSDLLHPWEKMNGVYKDASMTVKNMDQLNKQLVAAKKQQRPVMLDFYADWCGACVIMDREVFSREDVQAALASYVVLRADVTANNAFDQALLKRFHVVGPPTILFFDRTGVELISRRIVGEVNAKEFLTKIKGL